MSRFSIYIQLFMWISYIDLNILHFSNAKFHLCKVGNEYKEYDSSIKICCNGEIGMRVRDQECCDKTFYFTSLSICCEGKVEDRFVPPIGSRIRDCSSNDEQCREQTCCGGMSVDKEDTMCCHQQPIPLNHSQQLEKDFLQCCGENVTSTLTHFCCGGNTYPLNSAIDCCDGKVFDKQAEKCLRRYSPQRIVGKYSNMCGNEEYDMRKNSCCRGTLHSMPEMDPNNPLERNSRFSCCDDIAYDNTKENCCRESHTGFPTHTIVSEPNIYCCGNGSFNAVHQDCYNGTKLEKVLGKVRCGYGYIDGEIERCCDNTIYNSENQQCCMGDKVSVISNNQDCCNGEGINETMLCCDGITPCIKRRLSDDECCYNYKTNTAKTYSSKKNEHCVEGEVIQLPRGALACGISNFYFPKYQICCGKLAYNISAGYDQCCDDKPYKSTSQQCCNYEISNISPTDGSCCSKDFRVYRFNDTKNPCRSYCGNEMFDDTQQICCQGVVHELNDDTECCGSSTISSYHEGCCGDLFSWSRNGNTRCCGDRDLYNKKHAKCRNNKIVLRDQNLKNLTDVQYLCSRSALKYFDGGVKYACQSQKIFSARLINVQVLENLIPNNTYISLTFVDVTVLERGDNFNSWIAPLSLVISIDVPKRDDIKCKKSYFNMFCKVIVFFNGKLKGGNVQLGKNSKFFMTSYTRKRETLVTKKLSFEFCKNNFGGH